MGKIFCIMGKSGSGKDTVFKEIKDDSQLNLKGIISYTTRPKRKAEMDGVEYFFINEETLKKYEKLNKIIEVRVYNTINGKWYYCTIDDGQINLQQNNYIIITTLEAYESLKKYYGVSYVVPIYITIDNGIRLERALKRERQQTNPNYEELCRRFLADSIDFHEDKLKACDVEKFYVNYELEECVSTIKRDILSLIRK